MVTQQIHVDVGADRVTATAAVTVDDGGVDQTVSADQPSGFTVPAGEVWEIAGLVTTPANVVVEGTLRMRSGATLRFRDVSEAAFVGGDAATPLASDVGLWMIGQGSLDARGTPKTPWTRAAAGIAAGATSFDVLDASGWLVGDEIVVTATVPRSVANFWTKDDRRTVTAIDGSTVTVDSPLTNPHPATSFSGATYTAEVLNLTRDVMIEGTPGGRAHVIYLHQGDQPAFTQGGIGYVELRHLAPRTSSDGVTGRYALHYHHSHDNSDGVTVTGVVAHDCGGHVFVAHQSNGVTFDRCISHDTAERAYWWDLSETSDRIVYDRCVASKVRTFSGAERFTSAGFFLNKTSEPLSSKCIGCVATGIDGTADANGFFWDNASVGVWTFEDCLSHNIRHQGIRVWQNSNEQMHPLDRFRVYACPTGVDHGAYSNSYQYHDLHVHDCGLGIKQRATSHQGGQEWHDVLVTGCPVTLEIGDGPVDTLNPVDFRRSPFGQVRVTPTHAGELIEWDFTDCGLLPEDFVIVSTAAPFRLRTQDTATGEAWQLTDAAPWTPIQPF